MKAKTAMLCMCLLALTATAQEPLKWSVNAGLGISNLAGSDASETDGKPSWMVGVGVDASRGLVKLMDGVKAYHMNVLLSAGYRF